MGYGLRGLLKFYCNYLKSCQPVINQADKLYFHCFTFQLHVT
jgi:hypothetical protein